MTWQQSMLNSVIIVFKFVCLCLAILLTIKQAIKYMENNDSSILTYKKFADNPDDYPTFSFCFSGDPLIIYTNRVRELQISPKEFSLLWRV